MILLNSELDFINLMSYDFNGASNKYTGHNSPLYPRADEKEEKSQLNIVRISDYTTHTDLLIVPF